MTAAGTVALAPGFLMLRGGVRGWQISVGASVCMVGARGFEPPAPASRRRCSTRLSYAPTFFFYNAFVAKTQGAKGLGASRGMHFFLWVFFKALPFGLQGVL